MDHNVNHQQTDADKGKQTVKKPKYTKTLWPLLGKSQQASCKAINKDREKREKTFSQRQRSPSFHFLHSMKKCGYKVTEIDIDGGFERWLMMMVLQVSVFQSWALTKKWDFSLG